MATADTNLVGLRLLKEASFGVHPGGAYQGFRYTNSSLGHAKQTVASETLRSDRMRDFLAEVSANAEGEVGWELAFGTEAEILLQAGLHNAIATDSAAAGAATITVLADTPVAGQATYARATGNYDADLEGALVKFGGFTNTENDGTYKIVTATGSALVVDNAGAVTEGTASGSETYDCRYIRNGGEDWSLSIEQEYSIGGTPAYVAFRGMRVDTIGLNVAVGEIVKANVGFQGLEATVGQESSSETATGTTQPMNATTNIATGSLIVDDGSTPISPALRSISLNFNNNLRPKRQIGAKFPIDIGLGYFELSGTFEAYFQNTDLYNKFLAHTEVGISFRFVDAAGNIFGFNMPRCLIASGNPTVPGGNEDVIQSFEYTAIRSNFSGQTNQYAANIDLLAA